MCQFKKINETDRINIAGRPCLRAFRLIPLMTPALILFLLLIYSPVIASPQGPYQSVAGLIDLRTTWSDGTHSVEELVEIARSRGFRVLFINDHDRIDVSYGLPPFRNILRNKKTYPSIMSQGAGKYLSEIQRVSEKYPDMLLIPGCEASAYYYWTGSWFKKDLTLHEYDRRILILNFNKAEDYEGIPNMGNTLSLRYTERLLPGLVLFAFSLIIGAVLLKWRGFTRYTGLLIVVFSVLALIDSNPFRSSLFTAYHGDQGIAPFQELIDYVNERGGLSFWNYPEQRSGNRQHGPVFVKTPPYPEVLHQSEDYTGFSAIYGDRITLTEPGREWDGVLKEYCRGLREKAPWAISTADFHEEGRLGLKLGAFPTTFLVKTFSRKGVLEAARKGRMYCSLGDGRFWPKLEEFHVSGREGEKAHMGEALTTTQVPVIRFRVSHGADKAKPLTLYLIRGGTLIGTFKSEPPVEVEFADREAPPGEKTFYRLMDARKHLTSNPIFVTYNPPPSG